MHHAHVMAVSHNLHSTRYSTDSQTRFRRSRKDKTQQQHDLQMVSHVCRKGCHACLKIFCEPHVLNHSQLPAASCKEQLLKERMQGDVTVGVMQCKCGCIPQAWCVQLLLHPSPCTAPVTSQCQPAAVQVQPGLRHKW